MTFKALPIATNQPLLLHLDGEAVESVAVSSKSEGKKSATPPNASSVRDSLWWIPVVWRALKWLRKRSRKRSVTTVRLRKDEEVIIRKKDSSL
jgi:hypothetical protein